MSWKESMKKETESSYLSAKDLGTGVARMEIADEPRKESFANGDKWVLPLTNGKSLVLNKTNMKALLDLIDTKRIEFLAGHKISLIKQQVMMQGSPVDGVRIIDLE